MPLHDVGYRAWDGAARSGGAAAVIAAVPVMLLFSLLEKHLVNAITSGAVKG